LALASAGGTRAAFEEIADGVIGNAVKKLEKGGVAAAVEAVRELSAAIR
jgi:hypothetical protein